VIAMSQPDRDDALEQDTPAAELDGDEWIAELDGCEQNERLVIEIALSVMRAKGWIEEPDRDLIHTLRRLYATNDVCQITVIFNGDLLHDLCAGRPGEYLAGAYERECEENWERHEAPRWSCPCGVTYGLISWGKDKVQFYTLTDDALFDEQTVLCPSCQRDLARVRGDHATGQLGLF
jgi:hypothetical protein